MPDVNDQPGVSPDVKPATEPVVPITPAAEFLDRAKIELDMRLMLRQEYERTFQMWKANEFADLEKRHDEIIIEGLKKYYQKVEEERKPPTTEDIQKLLDQEYETFSVPVQIANQESGEAEQVMFAIRELPQSVEKRFYQQFKAKVMDKIQLFAAMEQSDIDKPFEDRAKAYLTMFDESFDMLAEATTLVLNPFGKRKHKEVVIDKEWVQNNIGSDRQWRIVEAQIKVNRLRDFFSKVSTSGQDMRMTMRPNFRALQQLVA